MKFEVTWRTLEGDLEKQNIQSNTFSRHKVIIFINSFHINTNANIISCKNRRFCLSTTYTILSYFFIMVLDIHINNQLFSKILAYKKVSVHCSMFIYITIFKMGLPMKQVPLPGRPTTRIQTEQVDVAVMPFNSYIGGSQFETHQISLGFLWFSSVSPGKWHNSTFTRPQLLPYKSFLTHLSTYHLLLYSMSIDRIIK